MIEKLLILLTANRNEEHAMKKAFVMEWPSLGIEVGAEALAHNIEVFNWFLDNLPLTTLQGHAVISGELLYVMNLLMKTTLPVKYRDLVMEDLSKEPVGRVSLFATAGKVGSIMVKYGPITEPMSYPTIAQVREEDLGKLKEVGRAVWNSIYNTKEVIKVTFKRGES